jgi:hypothetical protein
MYPGRNRDRIAHRAAIRGRVRWGNPVAPLARRPVIPSSVEWLPSPGPAIHKNYSPCAYPRGTRYTGRSFDGGTVHSSIAISNGVVRALYPRWLRMADSGAMAVLALLFPEFVARRHGLRTSPPPGSGSPPVRTAPGSSLSRLARLPPTPECAGGRGPGCTLPSLPGSQPGKVCLWTTKRRRPMPPSVRDTDFANGVREGG